MATVFNTQVVECDSVEMLEKMFNHKAIDKTKEFRAHARNSELLTPSVLETFIVKVLEKEKFPNDEMFYICLEKPHIVYNKRPYTIERFVREKFKTTKFVTTYAVLTEDNKIIEICESRQRAFDCIKEQYIEHKTTKPLRCVRVKTSPNDDVTICKAEYKENTKFKLGKYFVFLAKELQSDAAFIEAFNVISAKE